MSRTIETMLLVVLFVAGCKNDSNPISTVSTEPAFMIDTMKVSATVRTDTSTGPPGTYLSLRLGYHFAGRPGSLDGISVSASEVSIVEILEPYGPTPIGLHVSSSPEFRDPHTFPGQDSVFVRIGFGGRFWERNDATITDYGSFSIRDSLWIQLQR